MHQHYSALYREETVTHAVSHTHTLCYSRRANMVQRSLKKVVGHLSFFFFFRWFLKYLLHSDHLLHYDAMWRRLCLLQHFLVVHLPGAP